MTEPSRICALVSALVLGVSVGCVHKPEGPAERIGRSIDEISAALDDMGRSNENAGDRERMRRERERREREAAARRSRNSRQDEPFSDERDEFADADPLSDEFDSSSRDDDDPFDDSLDRPSQAEGAYPRRSPPIDRGETRY